MSQTKVSTETLEVSLDQIKPSPYQPRITFDMEDIRESIQQDGILVPLTVRRKDGYYELIDGERRVRLARELGYKTLPCTVIRVDDDAARRMVWKVNIFRKDYEPKEKALFFSRMKEEYEMNLSKIAAEYGVDSRDVKAYLNVFKLPGEYQEMIWNRVIPIRNIRELDQLFNRVSRATPRESPEIFDILDRSTKERHFGAEQIREVLKPYLAKLREEQIEKAKDALAEIKPEMEVPETSEAFEEAAKVFKRRAQELRSPEQILEEKRAKARKTLSGSGVVLSKITRAKESGIDTTEFERQIEGTRAKIATDPDGALREVSELRKSISKVIGELEDKKREAEIRKKLERQFKDERREEVKEELLRDEEFQKELRTEVMKEMIRKPEIPPSIEMTEEEVGVLQERIENQRKRMMEWMLDPEIQKRGKLFKNWVAHGAILDVMGSVFCPNDPDISTHENLRWSCCGSSVSEAYDTLREELSRTRKSKKK